VVSCAILIVAKKVVKKFLWKSFLALSIIVISSYVLSDYFALNLHNYNVEKVERIGREINQEKDRKSLFLFYGIVPSRTIINENLIVYIRSLNGGVHIYDIKQDTWEEDD